MLCGEVVHGEVRYALNGGRRMKQADRPQKLERYRSNMHYPGCKRAHKHGAAGSFVGSGRRRNPTRGIDYDAVRKKLRQAEENLDALEERYKSVSVGSFSPKQLRARDRRLMALRVRMGKLSEKIKALRMGLMSDGWGRNSR